MRPSSRSVVFLNCWLVFSTDSVLATPFHESTPIADDVSLPDSRPDPLERTLRWGDNGYTNILNDSYLALSPRSHKSHEKDSSEPFSSRLQVNVPESCFDVGDHGCNSTLSFSSMADLSAAAPKLQNWCLDQYAIGVLLHMLNEAVDNYTKVDNGYDTIFDNYVTYVQSVTANQVLGFVLFDNDGVAGAPYFDCTFQNDVTNENETTQTCPLNATWLNQERLTIYYEMKPGHEANYSAALFEKAGVGIAWTEPGTVTLNTICERSTSLDPDIQVDYSSLTDGELQRKINPESDKLGCTPSVQTYSGYPKAKPSFTVSNPKDVMNKVLTRFPKLRLDIEAPWTSMTTGFWGGANDDVTQVASTAIFLFIQAVHNTRQAKMGPNAETAAEKKAYISKILTVVFSALPFLNGANETTESLSAFGRTVGLTGGVSNTSLGIFDIVKDSSSALVQMFNILLNSTRPGSVETFSQLAALRRGMSAADVAKVCTIFEHHTSLLDSLVKACYL